MAIMGVDFAIVIRKNLEVFKSVFLLTTDLWLNH